ncbi:DNA polymerase IV [Corynebacterium frankenforstense]|uniref:DNA polymerase IV n=1 Tax=Corynebacterium frankenforstense TaxID=1230998 RepID=UPI0025506704|nr:DNA polymerase IV [Corynebacterium frankenforstense]MDK6259068.1 DNA polymerase IV [Corynebacterium frankenforstense]
MQRWVLHIDMDAFFASCEQLTRPTLRGRPVLVGGVSGRGVVAGASYEARRYGAHSAMPMHRATALVGAKAVLVAPRRIVYSTASRRVFATVARFVPADKIEQLSIDEAFLEPPALVGATAEEVTEWAEELRAAIREETGLPASVGAGSGKQFAKIGSGEAKPDGHRVIPHAEELDFLHPLGVDKLWGVGPVTGANLRTAGVETIGDLAAMSRREVELTLGATVGVQLWQLARGHDDRPVEPRAEAKSVSAEHTYPRDLVTRAQVDAAVKRAAEDAHRRLLNDGRGARTVTVKLRMADFHIESRSATLGHATDDEATLGAVARRLTRYPDEVGPVRLVGVGYSGLEDARQDVLFPELDELLVATPVSSAATDDYEVGAAAPADGAGLEITVESEAAESGWRATEDVVHSEFGHGWVQGTGSGVVTVRFETRATGPGRARTFAVDDPDLAPGDPLASLDWGDWLAAQEEQEE